MDTSGVLGVQPPRLGATLARSRLVDVLARNGPRLVFLTAPAGYGKTIVAAQFAESPLFEHSFWIDAEGQSLGGKSLLQWILSAGQDDTFNRPIELQLLATEGADDLESRLLERLKVLDGSTVCLVLDDVGSQTRLRDLLHLSDLLQSSSAGQFSLVVTARELEQRVSSAGIWHLTNDDLRLNDREAREYVELLLNGSLDEETVQRILCTSHGHAAIFAVAARHACFRGKADEVGGISQLTDQLRQLVLEQLDESERETLTVTTLVRHGSISDVGVVLGREVLRRELNHVAACLPLMHVDTAAPEALPQFRVHDLAIKTLLNHPVVPSERLHELLRASIELLDSRAEFVRALELALVSSDSLEVARLVEERGASLFDSGAASLLLRAFERIPVELLVKRPALLLLQARLEDASGNLSGAVGKARLAAELSEYALDKRCMDASRLLLGRVLLAAGQSTEAEEILTSVLRDVSSRVDDETELLLVSTLALAATHVGDVSRAEAHFERATKISASRPVDLAAKSYADGVRSYYLSVLRGEHAEASAVYAPYRGAKGVSAQTRLSTTANAAQTMCFRGLLQEATRLTDDALTLATTCRASVWRAAILDNRAAIRAAHGDYAGAEQDLVESVNSTPAEYGCDIQCALLGRATIRRAQGNYDGAFADSETAREYSRSVEMVHVRWSAEVESAASLLGLGDAAIARARVQAVVEELSKSEARSHLLRARLVLAECDREEGEDGVGVLLPSVEYILSGNGNWTTAMYIRAFPGLLGIVAKAVGADRIPAHLLRMILPANVEKALPMARDVLSEEEWATLARRLGVSPEEAGAQAHATPVCRVRLFGGLEVEAGGRRVSDADWRKRKARLLFAMLVVRKGRDVPREQLLEYLWPDMDSERAIANFYVVWNNMKNALCPGLPKGHALPYARTAGGVCRLDDLLVSSDLDEFERALAEVGQAEDAEDTQAIERAAQRLIELYRGDLLPGDIYDDWFAPLRERCRQEFGDAMLRAGRLLETAGDHVAALQMVRAALSHDAWREDLYQAALRCQIASGQRSAAIDTYMTCMHKLSEDLGLDPSAETRKLYERVLAMETPAEEGYAV